MTSWLYVSRRLDLLWLPEDPLFGDVILVSDRPHFRLTARVAVWLEHAADALDRRWADGQLTPADRDEALAALRVVWEFAAAYLDPATLRQARTLPPELPPVPAVPVWEECYPLRRPEPARPHPVPQPAPRPTPKRVRSARRTAAGERFAADAGPLFTAAREEV